MTTHEAHTPPVRLPRRDLTHNPPAVLCPLFAALDRFSGPIGKDDLLNEIAAAPFTAADLGDAIVIDTGAYVRTLVRSAPHYEVLVMAWLPGQRSPAHDHGGSCCCVRIVSGHAAETTFALRPDGLVEPAGEKRYAPGDVCCSVDDDIHALGNARSGPVALDGILVTLHVYSPPLPPTRKYTVVADTKTSSEERPAIIVAARPSVLTTSPRH